MTSGHWGQLTTTELARLDRRNTVVILPVAAIEQHGPHLPLATDSIIGSGIVDEALQQDNPNVALLALPLLSIGHSPEHGNFAGTLSLDVATILETWCAVAASVSAAGFRRLVIVNAHGGQRSLVDLAAVRLRAEHGLCVARFNYFSLGVPDDLFDREELRLGIHGGEIETSLMLHIAPHLVRKDFVADFSYRDQQRARHDLLSYEKPVGLGWLSEDLNEQGVVGNAANADAERGRRYLEYLGNSLVSVCEELKDIQLPDSSAR